MKKLLSLLLCLALLCSLSACSASSATGTVRKEAAEEAAPAMMAANDSVTLKSTESGTATLPEGRKWIITIDMDVETEDLDVLMADLEQKISDLGGYVEDQSVYNGSDAAPRRYRSANLTVRIPDEKVEQFTGEVTGISNVVSQNLRREDITLQYVATSSRVTALETEETRLLELLAEAETMADLLEIEARLTDVRYELENYASQLRLYDNQVDYATAYLYISEVQEYTPVEEPTFFERIRNTFSDSMEGLGDGIVDVTVFLIGNSPYLLACCGLAAALGLLIRRSKKSRAARNARKKEQE